VGGSTQPTRPNLLASTCASLCTYRSLQSTTRKVPYIVSLKVWGVDFSIRLSEVCLGERGWSSSNEHSPLTPLPGAWELITLRASALMHLRPDLPAALQRVTYPLVIPIMQFSAVIFGCSLLFSTVSQVGTCTNLTSDFMRSCWLFR
jgi:hypothetical protein